MKEKPPSPFTEEEREALRTLAEEVILRWLYDRCFITRKEWERADAKSHSYHRGEKKDLSH